MTFSGSGAPGLKRAPIASGFPLKKGICNPNRPPGGKSRYHGCPFQTWCVGGHNNYPKGDRMLQKPSKSHISLNSTSWTSSQRTALSSWASSNRSESSRCDSTCIEDANIEKSTQVALATCDAYIAKSALDPPGRLPGTRQNLDSERRKRRKISKKGDMTPHTLQPFCTPEVSIAAGSQPQGSN